MNTNPVANTLATLFGELVHGAPASGGYMLNAGDAGMLRSLDNLSATAASAPTTTGSSIAAHVDHVRYGLSLMNRWSAGENPFGNADWSASWKRTTSRPPPSSVSSRPRKTRKSASRAASTRSWRG